jgi:polynucleotide 5'-hydroxyl-kinase GRC3/NOL9
MAWVGTPFFMFHPKEMPEQSFYIPSWQRPLEAIEDDLRVIMTLGAPDSGKTTWIGSAVVQLGRRKCLPLAVLDANLGQTALGQPATVALVLLQDIPPEEMSFNTFPSCALYFVGSVSPRGHLLPTLEACTRLVERAKQLGGAQVVLRDTSGFVSPSAGFQLILCKFELLDPKHFMIFQREGELEPLLSVVSRRKGVHLHRLVGKGSVNLRTSFW